MTNSIAKIPNGAENYSIEEWRHFYGLETDQRLALRQNIRDPLCRATFRTEQVEAVFGYHIDGAEVNLVYFWQYDLKSHRRSGGPQMSSVEASLGFGALVSSICINKPNIRQISAYLGDNILGKDINLSKELDNLKIYWRQFDNILFSCVYRERISGSSGLEISSSMAFLECLSFHFDYFKLRSPAWMASPTRYLNKEVKLSHDRLARLHLHPKCFAPHADFGLDHFIWPWQECIKREKNRGDLFYEPIETTSLVFDLRKSTVAMEQLRPQDLGAFSPFIKSIVAAAKEIVFRHGGYFDKETGDGIVAHFFSLERLLGNGGRDCASKRAFDAAVEIIRVTATICGKFQSQLTFGIAELGGAIGIHTGRSVWIAEDNQVRAIGESVVVASRLCNEAHVRCIFLSNSEFTRLSRLLGPEYSVKFERANYLGKELRADAKLYGYSLRVGDDI